MKQTCIFCGGVHQIGEVCKKKPAKKKKDTVANRFRQTKAWRKKAREIKERDKFLCQYCLRVYDIPNTKNLEAHHIISIEDDYSKRLDDNNIITLCRICHEEAEDKRIKAEELQRLIYPPT